jgi:hypothetical protein
MNYPVIALVVGPKLTGVTTRASVIAKQVNPDKLYYATSFSNSELYLDDVSGVKSINLKFKFLEALDHLSDAERPLLMLDVGWNLKLWHKVTRLMHYVPRVHPALPMLNVIIQCQTVKGYLMDFKDVFTSVDYSGRTVCDIIALFPEIPKKDFVRLMDQKQKYDFLHRDQDGSLCLYNESTRKELPKPDPLQDLLTQLRELIVKVEAIGDKQSNSDETGDKSKGDEAANTPRTPPDGGLIQPIHIIRPQPVSYTPYVTGTSGWSTFDGDL